MSATTAVARGRRMAESLMADTCTIRRIDPSNPTTTVGGIVTPNYLPTPVYVGRCKIQTLGTQDRQPEAGGHTFTEQDYRLDVPITATYAPKVGDFVTIDTSLLDPNLDGRTANVKALLHKTYATAYRLGVTFVEA